MQKNRYIPPLSDCPHCGGAAEYHIVNARFMLKKYHGRYLCAGCRQCGVSTGLFEIQKTGSSLMNEYRQIEAMRKAADVWNRRV